MRRYHVTTFGCQMNAHDSERIKGMLESLGLGETAAPEAADVLVFNTCTIREKPDTRLAAYLGNAAAWKRERPDLVVAVGGCYAEAQQERIFELYPFVDVAFGPGSIPHLGDWIAAGGYAVPQGRFGAHEHFAADLPMHRERNFQAWVQVSMGCNSACAYCIVPAVRGREQSRRPGEIVAEVTRLAREGVREVTLLGQNVNSYRDPLSGLDSAGLLREVSAVDGLPWLRFLTSHPKDFPEGLGEVMSGRPNICRQLHLPLQSGSDAVLKRMKRGTTRERYLEIVSSLRRRMPEIALSTDVIVGFPGETERDFEDTLDLLRTVRFAGIFSFRYSPRPLTMAAGLADDVPLPEKQRRLAAVQEIQKTIQIEANARRVGQVEEVLCLGRGKKTPQLFWGRNEGNLVVNFSSTVDRAGKFVTVKITGSGPYSLRGEEISP